MNKIIISFIVCLLSACSISHGNFTVLSNKIVDLENFNAGTSKKIKNVTGKDTSHVIIFFPIGKLNPNINDALNDVFRNADGDLMTDVSVVETVFYIPYIYGKFEWKVKGDVLKTRNN